MEITTSRLLLILRKDQTRDESEFYFNLMWKESIELNLEGERQLNYYFKLRRKGEIEYSRGSCNRIKYIHSYIYRRKYIA